MSSLITDNAATERFFLFYGMRGAKLGTSQSIRVHVIKQTWLVQTLSPLLFFAPDVHLRSLQKMWIDKTIKAVPWKNFLDKLEREWEQFILYVRNFASIVL